MIKNTTQNGQKMNTIRIHEYVKIVCLDAPFCPGYLFRFNFYETLGPFRSDFEFEFWEFELVLFISFYLVLSCILMFVIFVIFVVK